MVRMVSGWSIIARTSSLGGCPDATVPGREAMGVELFLVRHGETEWSRARRHTGRTDLPLSAAGEAEAGALRPPLRGPAGGRVLSSPPTRAVETTRLAGFGDPPEIPSALLEFDYGEYEVMTTP